MFLVDTHSHLYLDAFEDDREAVIRNAKEAGLYHVLLPNIDVGSIPAMRHLAGSDPPYFHRMMGLHPGSVFEDYEVQLESIEKELFEGHYLAVGEIGIDLYWDKTYQEYQEQAFDIQLTWAVELGLPVAIHTRESFDEVMRVIAKRPRPGLKGVFHCFSGSRAQADRILELGFYLGIGGVLTFKNSKLSESIRGIPQKSIVLETDAPYLAPTPHRGKRNESAYTLLVAEKLSEVWGVSLEECARITTENACSLFGLKNPYDHA